MSVSQDDIIKIARLEKGGRYITYIENDYVIVEEILPDSRKNIVAIKYIGE